MKYVERRQAINQQWHWLLEVNLMHCIYLNWNKKIAAKGDVGDSFIVYISIRWYLNQCRLIVYLTLRNKLQFNSNQNTELFIHENAFESKRRLRNAEPFSPGGDDLNILYSQGSGLWRGTISYLVVTVFHEVELWAFFVCSMSEQRTVK